MFTKIVTQTDLSTLITLDEAKNHLHILNTDDDDYITSLIPVACDLAQAYCHKLLTEGTVKAECDLYQPKVLLPWGNVSSITSVTLDDEDYTDYEFREVQQALVIPDTYSRIEIEYECGYSTIPASVKQGILVLISTMYNYRDDSIVGYTVADLPLPATRLLDKARYYAI